MNLNFVIDEKLLFFNALIKGADIEGWKSLRNNLWDRYKNGYKLLKGDIEHFVVHKNIFDLNIEIDEIKNIFDEGLNSAEFKNLYEISEKYKSWLLSEWEYNKNTIIESLQDIMGVALPKNEITVYVMNDKMRVGRHLGNNSFAWGHSEDWPHYSMVYLAHEFLHTMFGKSKLEHAVIELITDNELRIRLNGTGDYLFISGRPVGHRFLLEIEKQLLPAWKEYLNMPERNIFEFVKNQKKD